MENVISGYDNSEEIMQEGETLLECMEEADVFALERTENGLFRFTECSDKYFSAYLTKDQVLRLADEIRAFAERA